MSDIDASHLRLGYGATTVLDDLSFHLAGDKIYGLLGRNGSGKTTLLSAIAAFRPPTGGSLLVDGADPFENAEIMSRTCFIRDEPDVYSAASVRFALDFAAALRPNWDADYAAELVAKFELPLRKRVTSLSRGMKSALGIVLGLAARAPLTIFDESYLGMDAPSRYLFYSELLEDYIRHPRTIIMSTHLIEEVGSLFEEVIILHEGRLLLHEDTDTLRARGVTVTGEVDAVQRFTDGMHVLNEQRLGNTRSITVYGQLDQRSRRAAGAAGLQLGPVPVQDLFIHLTNTRENQS